MVQSPFEYAMRTAVHHPTNFCCICVAERLTLQDQSLWQSVFGGQTMLQGHGTMRINSKRSLWALFSTHFVGPMSSTRDWSCILLRCICVCRWIIAFWSTRTPLWALQVVEARIRVFTRWIVSLGFACPSYHWTSEGNTRRRTLHSHTNAFMMTEINNFPQWFWPCTHTFVSKLQWECSRCAIQALRSRWAWQDISVAYW